jgi:hypothetical protein
VTVFYGFGDASGSGFGDTLHTPEGVIFRAGIWGDDLQSQSSNYRELFNLTEAMEEHVATLRFPHLTHLVQTLESTVNQESWAAAEIFLFTDNAVAESAFYKGSSSSRPLFELILRLRKLELAYSLSLHIIHVSGLRMQAQGTDHLSRGILHSGVLSGASMLDFIPLHLSATDRSKTIVPWCLSWLPPRCRIVPLQPQDWYFKGQGLIGGSSNLDGVWQPGSVPDDTEDCYLWTPPPAAADAAIEQLAFSRHKRPSLLHLFVCPRLMTHLWRKRLFKTADVLFVLPAGHRNAVWAYDMFEPLLVGICLPFLPASPWSRRSTDAVLAVAGQLSSLRSHPERDERAILRELWGSSGGA